MGWHDRQKGWGFTLLGCHPALPLSGDFFTPFHGAEYWQPCLYYKFPPSVTAAWAWGEHLTKVRPVQISGPGIWNSAWALSWSVYVLQSQEQGVGWEVHVTRYLVDNRSLKANLKRKGNEVNRAFRPLSSSLADALLHFPRVPGTPPAAL